MSEKSQPHVPAIEARCLTQRFGDFSALTNVSLTIASGEFFSVLGPSGSGKTTLLRLIAGLEESSEGTLRIRGCDASEISPDKRNVSMVFQSHALFPHLTVLQNISLGLRIRNLPSSKTTERAHRVMDIVKIANLSSRFPNEISGGEKQRVALARALVTKPEILLLDEPLGSLDVPLRRQLQIELRSLQRTLGITFVYVTHDREEALMMSDRIAVLNAGHVEQIDSPENLYEHPRTQFCARFIGDCNLVNGTVKADRLSVETELGTIFFAENLLPRKLSDGEHVTLSVRPEKILLGASGGYHALVEDVIRGGPLLTYRLRIGNALLNAKSLNTSERSYKRGEMVACEIPQHTWNMLND